MYLFLAAQGSRLENPAEYIRSGRFQFQAISSTRNLATKWEWEYPSDDSAKSNWNEMFKKKKEESDSFLSVLSCWDTKNAYKETTTDVSLAPSMLSRHLGQKMAADANYQ